MTVAVEATPNAPVDLGCTVWKSGSPNPDAPEECTSSPPWWESWSNCDMTPVHSEPWSENGSSQELDFLPWIAVEMGPVTATGHLFFGNRPLPVGDSFPSGDGTKILWTFDQRVDDFSATASNASDPSFVDVPVIRTSAANSNTSYSNQWPSGVNLPAAGCWTFTLHAKSLDGLSLTGEFTYIAVP